MWNRVAAFESTPTRTTIPASEETTQNALCPYATRVESLPTGTSARTLADLASIRTSEFPWIWTDSVRADALLRHAIASAQVARTTAPRCRSHRLRETRVTLATAALAPPACSSLLDLAFVEPL